ncbi:metal-dependent hydrolase family protein [Xylophilus sp. ASV27]|uniref:metal-dependent hydrolase family protein n=1 Tax=Xylophilus sp. ASV27 TaxID=2795129 RepID=UPI0018EA808A|nr:amidohydrolase family protein [Xylophilus sp. ASV27]
MTKTLLIKNARLLDPLKPELQDRHDILVEGGTIREVSDRPIAARDARVIDAAGRTVMPGLIDLHVHLVAVELNLMRQALMPNVLVTLRSLPILRGMLRRGFTTVRDAGGAGYAFKQAVQSGLAQGPRLFVSGRALSQTGGHGDGRGRSDYLLTGDVCPNCARVGAIARVADGVDAVRKAAREELQMGADQIKIMAGGGVASPTDPVDALGYGEDEVRAIVAEATARNTYVLAHAYTPAAIERVVRCGVRTIEHGNLVDAPAAALMAERGAYAVPTLVTYDALAKEGAALGLPPASVAKVEHVRGAGLRALEIYRSAGVKMGFGSDLLGESHRLQSDEFRLRSQVLSPAEVIASATLVGAEVLGMGDRLGRLAPGALADLLLVDGDPLRSLDCLLGQGERIPLVMKAGVVEFDAL